MPKTLGSQQAGVPEEGEGEGRAEDQEGGRLEPQTCAAAQPLPHRCASSDPCRLLQESRTLHFSSPPLHPTPASVLWRPQQATSLVTQTAPGPFPLSPLCPLSRLQNFRAAEAAEDSGGPGAVGVYRWGALSPWVPSPSPDGTELWSRPGVRWGHSGFLTCWAQVQPGLAGPELSTLLRLGLGGGTEEGEGEAGQGARDGGGRGMGLPGNHYAVSAEDGFLKS